MCWIMAFCVCLCVHLLITCCYRCLVTPLQVCIFPADWPQSASPLPAPESAVRTGAPAGERNIYNGHGTEGQLNAPSSGLAMKFAVTNVGTIKPTGGFAPSQLAVCTFVQHHSVWG